MAAAAVGLAVFAERKLSRLVLGGLGEGFSTRLYSAPYQIVDGAPASPERVLARLARLGYQSASPPERAGQFEWNSRVLTVHLRGFKTPLHSQQPGLRELRWDGKTWRAPEPASLEPEVAAELSGAQKVRREPADAAEIPELLKRAVIAAEDKRFHAHWGLDLRAIARAIRSNLMGRGMLQGASTITQQLSKNIFLTPRRNLRRKFAEAGLAVYLELRLSKEKILTIYLNHIYLGQEGPVSIAGVKAAAQFYFGAELRALTLGECAALAGFIRSPHRYNPFRNPAAAAARRDFVLQRMREEGYISAAEEADERRKPLRLSRGSAAPRQSHDNDYFVAEVVRLLLPRYGEETLFRHGLSIHTTLDPLLQRDAQRAAAAAKPQGALVALDPRTGDVLALSGGRNFGESQFNRATQARRQPGSAFKPFVYGAALEKGFTAATILEDKKRQYSGGGGGQWDPRNYDNVYFGTATVREALARSLNAATLDLAQKTGVGAVIDFARRMGVESELEVSLGAALGASEVTLLEIASAYAPFANGGWRRSPRLVTAIADAEGDVIEAAGPERQPALEPVLSYLMTSLLRSVVEEGTASSAAAWAWTLPTAGKTGTTNEGRDAWFIGYTPELLAGVWIGDDAHKAIRATGAKDALPVWLTFMKSAALELSPKDFERPEGLVDVVIDPASGAKARAGCPKRIDEIFKEGTQPLEDCPLHPGGVKGFFHRLFHRGG